jgi:hypothetical protein
MNRFGEKFSLKVCFDDFFCLSGVAGCPEGTTTFCFYYCSVREVAEAAKVCDFFYFHFSTLPSPGFFPSFQFFPDPAGHQPGHRPAGFLKVFRELCLEFWLNSDIDTF